MFRDVDGFLGFICSYDCKNESTTTANRRRERTNHHVCTCRPYRATKPVQDVRFESRNSNAKLTPLPSANLTAKPAARAALWKALQSDLVKIDKIYYVRSVNELCVFAWVTGVLGVFLLNLVRSLHSEWQSIQRKRKAAFTARDSQNRRRRWL